MAATIGQIVDGIEARLLTIPGLHVTDYSPDQTVYPAAFITVPEVDNYRATFGRGRVQLNPTVTVLTSASFDRIGQKALLSFAEWQGANSIPAAIEGDTTLGGLVDDCVVESFAPLGLEQMGAVSAYGGVFQLRIIALGKD